MGNYTAPTLFRYLFPPCCTILHCSTLQYNTGVLATVDDFCISVVMPSIHCIHCHHCPYSSTPLAKIAITSHRDNYFPQSMAHGNSHCFSSQWCFLPMPLHNRYKGQTLLLFTLIFPFPCFLNCSNNNLPPYLYSCCHHLVTKTMPNQPQVCIHLC